MTCGAVRTRLPGCMDGAISEREHSQVRAHLESCAACRRDLESYRRMAVQLAQLGRVAPPADLAVRIRVRASRAASDPGWIRRAWGRSALVFKNILGPPWGAGGSGIPSGLDAPGMGPLRASIQEYPRAAGGARDRGDSDRGDGVCHH